MLINSIKHDNRDNKRDDGVDAECPCCAHTLPPFCTSLSCNNIGPEGACALAETLRTNTTLTVLE